MDRQGSLSVYMLITYFCILATRYRNDYVSKEKLFASHQITIISLFEMKVRNELDCLSRSVTGECAAVAVPVDSSSSSSTEVS